MGWTFQEKPRDVKAELDRQLTWTNENGSRRVLDSAIVARSEYYAAVEHVKPDGERIVWAAAFMLKFVPRAVDGYTFGYKDMDETMGPYLHRCPVRILDMLTATDNEYTNAWRERCRMYHARRAALPKLVEGMRLRIKDAGGLTVGGFPLEECTVIRAGRKPVFSVAGYGSFRWPSWRQYNVEAV
jgi:hypothetical protein